MEEYILENGMTRKEKEKDHFIWKMEINMKVNGKMVIKMVKEYTHKLMEINMMDNSKMIREMVKE